MGGGDEDIFVPGVYDDSHPHGTLHDMVLRHVTFLCSELFCLVYHLGIRGTASEISDAGTRTEQMSARASIKKVENRLLQWQLPKTSTTADSKSYLWGTDYDKIIPNQYRAPLYQYPILTSTSTFRGGG